jgi:dihydrofolate synthase / folylpolyglutamate synthase
MNYRQTLDHLYDRLPMFQRIGAAAYKHDLTTTIEISRILGNPEKLFPSIHIAGTNGKGSVAHLIASVLYESGYKTGLFTSPHMKDFRERIRVNGKPIPRGYVTGFVKKHEKRFDYLMPSFFEYTFAMAMDYFRSEKVDVAVIEAGMGGRLDSTNVVQPVLTVITNIGFDHMQFLGDTLEKIASEKAGIIKQGVPVIVGETQEKVCQVFIKKASENNAPVKFADQEWRITKIEQNGISISRNFHSMLDISGVNDLKINCPLKGNYQRNNLLTVMQSLTELNQRGMKITTEQIITGIQNVIKNTGLLGRWQVLGRTPLTICDTAHNADGMKRVIEQINEICFDKLHFVIGMVNDKDIDSVLAILPRNAVYYFCKADIPRGLDPQLLRQKSILYGLKGAVYSTVKEAMKNALLKAGKKDMVFIGGSIFVVAEVV